MQLLSLLDWSGLLFLPYSDTGMGLTSKPVALACIQAGKWQLGCESIAL